MSPPVEPPEEEVAADDVDFAGDAVDEPLVDFVGDAPAPLRTLAASEPSAVVEAPSPTRVQGGNDGQTQRSSRIYVD